MASPHKDNLSPGWVDQDQNEQDGSHQSSPFGNPVQPDPFAKNSSPVASQEDKKPSHHEIAGDASALFGETSHAADPFFSSIVPAQDSLSFFDNVGASATDKPFDNTKQTNHDTQYEYQSQQTYAQTTETNSVGQYYNPSQQSYDPSQQAYNPSQQSYDPSQQSYDPSQQAYNPSQQAYDPSKQAYDPSQQAYDPSQQAYNPSKQAYDPSQQAYDPSQQAYDPSQQAYDPSQQAYDPSQQWYTFDPNQHYYYDEGGQLHFYDPNTGLDVDYQYPETTEEYQSDPQYAQYYDPNAYTAGAQYAVDQPATTSVAHSDAQPQSGASAAHETDKPSHGTDSYLHDTQNYAPFEPSATVTDKSIPSFEAEHSHPPISTRVELNRGETVESWNNTHAISSGDHEATVPTIVQTTVTGVAEVPVMEEDEDDRKGGLPMKKSESEQMNVFQNELGASDGYMSVNQYETVSNSPPKSPSIHKEALGHTDDSSNLNETVAWNTTQDPSDKYSPTHYQHQKEEFFYGEQNHETKEHMDTTHQKVTEEQTEYNDNVESVNFNQYGPTYGSTDQSTTRDVPDKDKSTLDTHAMTKDDIFSRYSNNHTNEQSVENVGDDLDDLVLGESDPTKDTKDHYPDYSNDVYNSSYESNAQQDYSTAYSPYNPTTTSAYEHSYETQTHQVSSTQYDTHETQNSSDITKNESSHEPHTQQQDYSSQYDNNTTDSANYEKTYEPYGQQDYSAQYDSYNPSGEETKNYDPEASFEYQDQQDYSAQKDIRDLGSSEKQESYEPHAYQDNSAQYGAYNTTSSDRAVPYGGTNSYEPQPTQDLPNHSESDKTHSQLSTSHQEERTSYNFSSYSPTEPQISNTHRGSFPGTTQGYGAPFEGYNHMPLERSSTVPPPPISRMVTPQPDIPQRCPHPACEGENKARAKFCCECGRPLAGISRSTTPAAPSTQGFLSYTPLNAGLRAYTPPVIDAYPPEVQRYTPNHLHQNVQESHETAVRAFIPEHHSPYDNSYVENSMDNAYGEEPIPQSLELPQDPLKRYGGCPLISFGFGGKMCLMFPHTVQRFTTAGYDTSAPIIKKMPSAIKICHLRDVVGGDQDSTVRSMSSFVGPVLFDAKSSVKAKKKEVLAYMDKRLEEYDSLLNAASSNGESLDDIENKSLLWKLVKTLIEQEGSLGDNDKMDAAVRGLLWPVSTTAAEEDNTNFSVPAYGQTTMASAEEEESDYSEIVLNKLQKFLENGDREGAVDYAVQEDMWAHALVISSCVNKELWKKVTNEFIERELCATVESKQTRVYHNVMGDKQALRVLYALFAGSGPGAMTEFVKSSEKHVTSHYGATPTTSPVSVEQLRQWRETLLLILANRTPRDVEAITALGDILKAQGWTGAAHFCYVVSPQSSLHSGIDAPHVRFTLLGVDGNNISKDLDGIHLSELYEYALSSKQATVSSLPFLQAYKLAYAWQLADYGFTALAQRYCEAIAGAIKANTKRTPWMHRQFVERLEEFAEICEISSGNSLSFNFIMYSIEVMLALG
ncbi:Sec23-binding domain of Sec16-domain-containing protein [Phycomyces nitens]|nr:Sec23-binding domain of Sec16-domain-containing protein [Phycomyces nitens]